MPKLYWNGKYVGDIASDNEQNVEGYVNCLTEIQRIEKESLRPLPEPEPQNLPMGLWATIKYKLGKFWESLSF